MATVEQTLLKVQRILTGPLGLRIQFDGDTISVGFSDASTRVHFGVYDWGTNRDGEPRTLVRVSAPILWEVRPTTELYERVAREGGGYFFGHVMVRDDEAGTVYLMMSHTLLGDYLDAPELEAAMWGVLGTADGLDDQLQAR